MSAKQSYRRNQIILLLVVVALMGVGLWLRFRFIHTVHLYPDEFVTLLAVQMIGEKGLPVLPSGLFFEHGLLFSYAGSVAALLGPARWTVRYASLLFGMATLGLTFWVGRRWFSPAAAVIALAGLAVAPAAIHWSGRARMYALLQLLVLATFWLAYRGVVYNQARWRWLALLLYLATLLTHFVSVTLAPPLLLAIAVLEWAKTGALNPGRWLKPRRWWLELAALAVVILIAFLVKRAGQPKGVAPLQAATALTGLAQVWAIYSDISLNPVAGWLAISPFFLTLPALIFAPFALFAAVTARPLRRHKPAIFLAVILLATTIEMVFLVSPDRRDDKYLFMLLPVLLLLGGHGLAGVATRLFTARRNSPFGEHMPGLLAALLISGLILAATRPQVQALLANTGDDYDSAFAYVQTHQQPGDAILTGTPAAAAFYLGRNDFYSVQRRGGYDYRILTVNGQAVDRWLASPAIRTEEALHQTLSNRRVWLVLERWGLQREYYDPPFQQQLLAQTDYITGSQGIFVLRSKPNPRPLKPDPAYPREAIFGDRVRLLGYTVEPDAPAAGQTLRLTLYWQAVSPMARDYTVFVHLRQPGGGNVAQADHQPLAAVYPTSLWPVGETIREASQLALPPDLPPGAYELWVGLYLLDTGERLPVQNDTSGENAVLLGRLGIGG